MVGSVPVRGGGAPVQQARVCKHHRAGANRADAPHRARLPGQPCADGLILCLLPQRGSAGDQQGVDVVAGSRQRRIRFNAHAVGCPQHSRFGCDDLELVSIRLSRLARGFVEDIEGTGQIQHLEPRKGDDGDFHGGHGKDGIAARRGRDTASLASFSFLGFEGNGAQSRQEIRYCGASGSKRCAIGRI
ncbi:hypothetical protein CBM2589_B60067 [Cupriavidus taiwanensis]|uniref:Uncharacterized protein n=1 Tax=Cupriavidus taiwanensis TaxID=164546 RepID=A0A375BWN8_9BURK|nr:hypothetical protein CBM2589_B60067 [Cupriavidus taiwanensis]